MARRRVSWLMTKPPEEDEQDIEAVPDVPARPAVRTPLLIARLGWLLVAAAFYWQSWLELHLRLIVLYAVDLAVLVVAFVPAISIAVGVCYELWTHAPGGQAMFSLCTQEYWIHNSGSIPAAAWATDLDLLQLSDFPARGRSLGDGWWWLDNCNR